MHGITDLGHIIHAPSWAFVEANDGLFVPLTWFWLHSRELISHDGTSTYILAVLHTQVFESLFTSYWQDNSTLRILNLSWNGFYLEGCRALVRTLQLNTTLEVLDLSNNRINRECLGHLVKGLAKNTTLHSLIVSFLRWLESIVAFYPIPNRDDRTLVLDITSRFCSVDYLSVTSKRY